MLRQNQAAADCNTIQRLLSVVLILDGTAWNGQGFVNRLTETLRHTVGKDDDEVELIVVYSDEHWENVPAVQSLAAYFRHVHLHKAERSSVDTQAILFNAGRAFASGHRLIFVGPRLSWHPQRLVALIEANRTNSRGSQSLAVLNPASTWQYGLPGEPIKSQFHGWILNCPFLEISDVAISAVALNEIGGFDTSPLLQQSTCWDVLNRLSASHEITAIKADIPTEAPAGRSTFFEKPYPISDDLSRRYMATGQFTSTLEVRERNFVNDLPRDEFDYLSRRIPSLAKPSRLPVNKPLRVLITGGPWEYHHNWLCFYSYFNHLEGTGFGTYKAVFDHLVTRDDVESSDVVVLSRCKVDQVRQILDWCKDLGVPSIYMIDDNWMTIADDWPQRYRHLFGPDTPIYRNFIFGIRHADYVLVYNKLLADDISPYAKRIITLPNSVNLELFERTARRVSKRFVVGYSGSERYDDRAFMALAQVAKEHDDVDVLIFGNLSDHQRSLLHGVRVTEYAGISYRQYAQTIREVSPDILLAPLDDTRTSRSKCPNKYLEITAAGAVGVYSNVEPYSWHIQDGINGVLVADPKTWAARIASLLDKSKLSRMHASARADVALNYDVPKVANQFADLLRAVAERKA